MDLGIDGKAALVTGASAGMGFAIARELSREGVRLAICSRDLERIERAGTNIREETGGEVETFVADVSVAGEPARLVEDVSERLGGLQILVANAGGAPLAAEFPCYCDL